ncbi:MAG: glycosyltransferase family 9 protein [Candidatus Adiutrix sp.]|nr:glycosyltransferase family 9 protein [Candidatus Adiutrix sp.]
MTEPRILVIQMARLGDFIQSTPLLAALRRAEPGAALVLAGGDAAVLEAARLSPLVDEVACVGQGQPEPGGVFKAVFGLNSALPAARLAGRVPAARRFGPEAEGEKLKFTPAQEFLLGLMAEDRRLARFNLADVWLSLKPGAGPEPLVWPADRPAPPAAGHFKIGFHLGARHHLRRWPVENFVLLARALGDLIGPFTPVLSGSAGERALGARFEKLLAGSAPAPLNLMGATNLKELGAVMAGLDLLVTADTGVMHLAAAVKTPVLALFFGPAYGPETGPYGPGHFIYQAEAPCGPCREGAGCRRRQCLALPEPEPAARLAAAALNGLAEPLGPHPLSGHRVWRTEGDGFGQTLRPLGRPPLTADEALALALTGAGRAVLRPGYEAEPGALTALAAAYAAPAAPLAVPAARLNRLSGRAGPGFTDRLRQNLAVLGVKIASS